jgi:hypothetical protein
MIPTMNTYDTIRTSLHFNKFVVGELLFVEYKPIFNPCWLFH